MGLTCSKYIDKCISIREDNYEDYDHAIYINNQICPIGSAKSPKPNHIIKKKTSSKATNGQ